MVGKMAVKFGTGGKWWEHLLYFSLLPRRTLKIKEEED